jgi:ArsR family transcriptional regulator
MNKYEKTADLLKVLSNPKRLEILDAIKDREVTVNELSKILGTRKSNTSQHLSIFRYLGLVKVRRDGRSVYYKLSNPKVINFLKAINKLNVN